MKGGKTKCEKNDKKDGASDKVENKVKSEKTNGEKDETKPIVEERPGVSNKILDDEIKPLDLSSLKTKQLEENENKCENGLKTKAEDRFSIKNIIFDEKPKPGAQTSIKIENLVQCRNESVSFEYTKRFAPNMYRSAQYLSQFTCVWNLRTKPDVHIFNSVVI